MKTYHRTIFFNKQTNMFLQEILQILLDTLCVVEQLSNDKLLLLLDGTNGTWTFREWKRQSYNYSFVCMDSSGRTTTEDCPVLVAETLAI